MNDTLLTILKVLASLGSAYIIVSPIPSMRRVYTARDTGEMQLLPLVGMLINYHILYADTLWLVAERTKS